MMKAIGLIHTPHKTEVGTPIQPAFAKECYGKVILNEELAGSLDGLEGFSHAWLIYGFHKAKQERLRVVPFMGDKEVGVFATRSPSRPNSIGMTLVEIRNVSLHAVDIMGVDMLDGTPLYDIKPFMGTLEVPEKWETGWLDEEKMKKGKPRMADDRFVEK